MNELAKLANEIGAPKDVAIQITNGLQKFFKDAEAERDLIDKIVITKPDQVDEMKKAREIRLKIKNSRLDAQKLVKDHREKLKTAMSEFTLQDKLWLKAFQMLEANCNFLEAKCEEKEKFAERWEAEQKQKRYEERVAKLHPYGTDPSIYNLSEMEDEAFNRLLNNEKLAYEARIEAEKKVEQQRVAEQKAEAERLEAIRKENERLKKEAEQREAELAKERAEQQKKLDAEKKAREQAEAKARAEKEAQIKKESEEKSRLDALKKAEEEKARQKLLAPDKEKLMDLANALDNFQLPAVSSKEAQGTIRATEEMISKMTNYIRNKAKAL